VVVPKQPRYFVLQESVVPVDCVADVLAFEGMQHAVELPLEVHAHLSGFRKTELLPFVASVLQALNVHFVFLDDSQDNIAG